MVPVGAILPFYGGDNQLPANYLVCNGDQIARASYPELYAHLIMANPQLLIDAERAELPDLRGEFLRGWDNQRNVDPQRRLGSVQSDELRSHAHTIPHQVQVHWPGHGGFHSLDGGNDTNLASPATAPFGGGETRPRNVAVSHIIRARP